MLKVGYSVIIRPKFHTSFTKSTSLYYFAFPAKHYLNRPLPHNFLLTVYSMLPIFCVIILLCRRMLVFFYFLHKSTSLINHKFQARILAFHFTFFCVGLLFRFDSFSWFMWSESIYKPINKWINNYTGDWLPKLGFHRLAIVHACIEKQHSVSHAEGRSF